MSLTANSTRSPLLVVLIAPDRQPDLIVLGKFGGIREQIEKVLTQLGLVCFDFVGLDRYGHRQAIAFFGDQRSNGAFDIDQELFQADRLDIELHLARLDLRKIEHIIDQCEKVTARSHDLAEIGDKAGLIPIAGILHQHFAIANDRIERRAQFVAHRGEETALFLAGDFRAAPCFLKLRLTVLQISDIGIDRDRTAFRRLALGNAYPGAVGKLSFHCTLRVPLAAHCLLEPSLPLGTIYFGPATLRLRAHDFFEAGSGCHKVRCLGENLQIALVHEDKLVIGVEQGKAIGNGFDCGPDSVALVLCSGFKHTPLCLPVAQQTQCRREPAKFVATLGRQLDILASLGELRHGPIDAPQWYKDGPKHQPRHDRAKRL